MGVVAKGFVGRSSASTKVNNSFIFNYLTTGINYAKVTGYFKWPIFNNFKYGKWLIHCHCGFLKIQLSGESRRSKAYFGNFRTCKMMSFAWVSVLCHPHL